MFSIKLPHGQDNRGELILGGLGENLFHGPLQTLPVIDDPVRNPQLNGTWAVPATSISVGNTTSYFVQYCVAVIDTDYPLIALRRDVARRLMQHLGFIYEHHSPNAPYVECSNRGLGRWKI